MVKVPVVLTQPGVTPVRVKLPLAPFREDDIVPVIVKVFCAPAAPADTMVICIAFPCPITPMVNCPEIVVPGPKQVLVSLRFRLLPVSVFPLWFIDMVKVRNWVVPDAGGTAVLLSVTDQKPLAAFEEVRVPPLPPQPTSARAKPKRAITAVFIRASQAVATPDLVFARRSNGIEMNSYWSEMSCLRSRLVHFRR